MGLASDRHECIVLAFFILVEDFLSWWQRQRLLRRDCTVTHVRRRSEDLRSEKQKKNFGGTRFEVLEPLSLRISVVWNVTWFYLIDHYHCFGRTVLKVPPKRLWRSPILHGVTSQKNWNLTNFFLIVFGVYMFWDSSRRKAIFRSAVGSTQLRVT